MKLWTKPPEIWYKYSINLPANNMSNFSPSDAARAVWGGVRSYITNRPLVVSFEVTLSCNCNCRHCDLGGIIKDEKQIKPDEFARLTRSLNPPLVQISGGEPLLRKDIVDIVRAIKSRIFE